MYALIVIVIFLLILAFIFYREYRNEKIYQKERKERHKAEKDKKRTLKKDIKRVSHYTPKKNLQKSSTDTKETTAQHSVYQQKLNSAIQTVEKATREKKTKEQKETVRKNNLDMPKYNYVQFDHSRLVKMGFSDKEAKEFVLELIPQIASQMPALQEAIEKNDLALIDNITHDLKGASGNIGSGGIADLMNDFNTYVKRDSESEVLQAYYKHMEHYYKELKQQYHA